MRLPIAWLSCVFVACGGTNFTGVADDASTSSEGGSDAAPGDGGAEGGAIDATIASPRTECTWSATGGGCPAGQYCEAPGCGDGTCAPIPRAETADLKPVCGCDKVTYWNVSVAHTHGMSVSAPGVCTGGKACSADTKCANGGSCNMQVKDSAACIANVGGFCWALPATCPSEPKAHECLAASCNDVCDLIAHNKVWYDDLTCP